MIKKLAAVVALVAFSAKASAGSVYTSTEGNRDGYTSIVGITEETQLTDDIKLSGNVELDSDDGVWYFLDMNYGLNKGQSVGITVEDYDNKYATYITSLYAQQEIKLFKNSLTTRLSYKVGSLEGTDVEGYYGMALENDLLIDKRDYFLFAKADASFAQSSDFYLPTREYDMGVGAGKTLGDLTLSLGAYVNKDSDGNLDKTLKVGLAVPF